MRLLARLERDSESESDSENDDKSDLMQAAKHFGIHNAHPVTQTQAEATSNHQAASEQLDPTSQLLSILSDSSTEASDSERTWSTTGSEWSEGSVNTDSEGFWGGNAGLSTIKEVCELEHTVEEGQGKAMKEPCKLSLEVQAEKPGKPSYLQAAEKGAKQERDRYEAVEREQLDVAKALSLSILPIDQTSNKAKLSDAATTKEGWSVYDLSLIHI